MLLSDDEKKLYATVLRRLITKGWKKTPMSQLEELQKSGYITAIGEGFLVTDKGDRLLRQVR